jgi:hypothetical protein
MATRNPQVPIRAKKAGKASAWVHPWVHGNRQAVSPALATEGVFLSVSQSSLAA